MKERYKPYFVITACVHAVPCTLRAAGNIFLLFVARFTSQQHASVVTLQALSSREDSHKACNLFDN